MFLAILTFLSALTISAVAIYYSVAGLAAIFAAAVVPIIVMGVSLEVGKLVTAVWLHRYWDRAVWWLRTYLAIAVVILMFITSMGIFGYLSKAHIEQTSMSIEQTAQIETIDDKLIRSQAKVTRWTDEIDRLMKGEDIRVDTLIEKEQAELDKLYKRINEEKESAKKVTATEIELQNERLKQAQLRKFQDIKAAKDRLEDSTFGGGDQYDKAVEEAKANELSVASSAQREIRNINKRLNETLIAIDSRYAEEIKSINDRIQKLRSQANAKTEDIDGRITDLEAFIDKEQVKVDNAREEKAVFEKQFRQLEADVGPIKYIAEFIYGQESDADLLERAVRWVIIVIIFVFDPLAVLLLIASQYSFQFRKESIEGTDPDPKDDGPDDGPDDNDPDDNDNWRPSNSQFSDGDWMYDTPIITDDKDKDEDHIELPKNISHEPEQMELPLKEPEEEVYVDPRQMELDFMPIDDEYGSANVSEKTKEPTEHDISKEEVEEILEQIDAESEQVAFPELPPEIVQTKLSQAQIRKLDANDEDWKKAKAQWKEDHPKDTIKTQKIAYLNGKIEDFPWEGDYQNMKKVKTESEIMQDELEPITTELDEAMEEVDGVDKWNNFIDEANKAAEEEDQKKKFESTNYYTKVSNKQTKQKTRELPDDTQK